MFHFIKIVKMKLILYVKHTIKDEDNDLGELNPAVTLPLNRLVLAARQFKKYKTNLLLTRNKFFTFESDSVR